MKILFDVNVPRKLRNLLQGHTVRTAQEQGWAVKENGELIPAAETAGFEVLITADQNIEHQQNMSSQKLAIVILSTNDWSLLKLASQQISDALESAKPLMIQSLTIPIVGTKFHRKNP